MDFLKKFTEATKIDTTKETPAPTGSAPGAAADEQAPSQSDVFASAQVLAQAAKATINKDPTNVDNYKLAGAAADILDAAEHYGKLDTSTGVGSYVEKAEGYLKQYETSNAPSPAKSPVETEPKSAPAPAPAPAAEDSEVTEKSVTADDSEVTEKSVAPPPPATEAAEEKAIPTPVAEAEAETPEIPAAAKEEAAAESKEGGGGYGGALKAAGDFWKKN